VWEGEHPCAEALHDVSLEIELEDRVLVREGAVVRATPRQHPDVSSIGIGKNPADHADLPSAGQLLPTVNGVIRIIGYGLGTDTPSPHRHRSGKAGHPYCHRYPFDPTETRHLDLRQTLEAQPLDVRTLDPLQDPVRRKCGKVLA
jgi:hypothetical protein